MALRRIGPTAYLTGLVDGAARTGGSVVAIPAGFYALDNKVYVSPMVAWNARTNQPLYLANVGGSRRLSADTSAAVLHSLGISSNVHTQQPAPYLRPLPLLAMHVAVEHVVHEALEGDELSV